MLKLRIATCCLFLLTCSTLTHAKDNYARDNELVRGAFVKIVAPATKSTTLVYSNGKRVSVGTIVDAKGFVLTKASELRDNLECELRGGERIKAKIVGIAERDDLALLKIETKAKLQPITWAKDVPLVGSWLATVGLEDRPVAVGVVSVPTRTPRNVVTGAFNRGFLGVTVSGGAADIARIARISPGSPAHKAKVRVNDVVTHVNGKEVKTGEEMIGQLQGKKVGDLVELDVIRSKKKQKIKITLGWFGGINQEQNTLGGPLSGRRFGFPSVFQHDSYLRPEHCGGPLLNTDGQAVGINIARVGRVSSQAIPVKAVLKLLPDLMSGKLSPEKNVSAKKPEIKVEKKADPKKDKKDAPKKSNDKKAEKKKEPPKKKESPKKTDKKK